jgi:tetratricopeptide (TPR) repeat protein
MLPFGLPPVTAEYYIRERDSIPSTVESSKKSWYPFVSGDEDLGLAAIKIISFFLFGSAAAFAGSPQKILVFPLQAPVTASDLSWLGEGIAYSISSQLSGPGIKTMDREERFQLVENLDLPPGAQLSHGSMIRVAQEGKADLVVWGSFSEGKKNLKVSVRILNVKTLRLSGEMTANGPLSALPLMENELSWLILNNTGMQKGITREDFGRRARKAPNTAFAMFIESFDAAGKNEQIRLLRRAVEEFKEFPEAHFQLARIYFQNGDWNGTQTELDLSGRVENSDLEYEFMRGTCYTQQEQPQQAIQNLLHVLSSSRTFQVLNNIGVAYLRKGDEGQALNAFMEAKNLLRTDINVALNLAVTRHMQGNDAGARIALEEAIKAHPQNGMLQFVWGIVLSGLGENEGAAAATARAKDLGLNVDKLKQEDPKKWCLVHTTWKR